MKLKSLLLGMLCGLAATLAVVSVAHAQTTLDLAKKEGKVNWYANYTSDIAQKVCDLFNSKKLGIECVLNRGGASELYERYLREAKSGIYIADVLNFTNQGNFLALKKNGDLLLYKPVGSEKLNPLFQTSDGSWTVIAATAIVVAYNTKYVKPDEVPTSWKDFLKPHWKGRLVHANPGYSGSTVELMLTLVNAIGWDFYKGLAAQNPRIVQSLSATLPLIERGEGHVAVGVSAFDVRDHIARGEPLKMVVPSEGVSYSPLTAAIMKNAPHPNAAKVFMDFLLTNETQQLLVDQSLHVGSSNVKYPAGQVPLESLKINIVSPEELQKRTPEIIEQFRKIFGV